MIAEKHKIFFPFLFLKGCGHLGMDVGGAPCVTAREDSLKGGQAIDISHDQASQERQLICLACSYSTSCCSPYTT